MRWLSLLTTLALSIAVTANSGIFASDGSLRQVVDAQSDLVPQPRAGDEASDNVYGRTNAQRLRRGQPLLPPKRRNRIAARSLSSSLPPLRGIVLITRQSDAFAIGYLRKTFDGQNSYTIGPLDQALQVSIPNILLSSTGTGPFEITAIDGPSPVYPFVGAVGGSAGYDFGPGKVGYAYLAGTAHSNSNDPFPFGIGHSIQSLGYQSAAESNIWFIDPSSFQFSAQWTNLDGSQPPTSTFYDPAVDFLGLVGDFDKFVDAFPNENAVKVTMTFVPT